MALAAGAYGGLITPSMMLGSTIAFAAAAAWNSVFSEMPSESAAVVGAAVFLGVSLKMPLTAIVFILELTYAPRCLTHAIMHRHGRRSMGGEENGI